MAIGRQTISDISFAELQRFFGLGLTFVAVSNADATPHGLAARSLASVGLGALLGLPLLLLASVAFGAPLAGPAAISLGYLATARALVQRHMRSAMLWSIAVVLALVAWAALAPLVGSGRTWPGLAAAFLAPAFAAAPALVRLMMRPRARIDSAAAGEGEDADPRAATPNPLREGAADVIDATELVANFPRLKRIDPVPAARVYGPRTDLGEAIEFVLRHIRRPGQRGIAVRAAGIENGVLANCDRQACRRIVGLLVADAVQTCGGGAKILVSARNLKGAALLRIEVGGEEFSLSTMQPDSAELSAARDLVEKAGGTLIVDTMQAERRISVRLASGSAAMSDSVPVPRSGSLRRCG